MDGGVAEILPEALLVGATGAMAMDEGFEGGATRACAYGTVEGEAAVTADLAVSRCAGCLPLMPAVASAGGLAVYVFSAADIEAWGCCRGSELRVSFGKEVEGVFEAVGDFGGGGVMNETGEGVR